MKLPKILTIIQLTLMILAGLILYRHADIHFRDYKRISTDAEKLKLLNTRASNHRAMEQEGIAYVHFEMAIEHLLGILFLLIVIIIQFAKFKKNAGSDRAEPNFYR